MEALYHILREQLKFFFDKEQQSINNDILLFQPTNKEHKGHITLTVFPIAKQFKSNPADLAEKIGQFLSETKYVKHFEVIKGFLNLNLSTYSFDFLLKSINNPIEYKKTRQNIVLEYCGPNTNKPLHIGHLRNMFLGYSVAEILRETGNTVHKVNIFNDRGIAICKSMIAYKLYGNKETPESSNLKGDFLVGKYYVKYNEVCSKQVEEQVNSGLSKEEAEKNAPIFLQANDMLLKWEAEDTETIALWNKMNTWFYDGVRQTYGRLGIDTEKDYYESNEYKKGKEIVEIGYQSGVFQKDETGAIFIDLTDKGLDKKYLQRSNGTSLYITQDMALVKQRFDDFNMDKMIYVVGDEQNYHFKVLKYIMEAMNESFSKDIYHLSYGLVLGKDGSKFKSREGTAADADTIVDMVVNESKTQTIQSGKAEHFTEDEIEDIAEKVGLGALKYALLKVSATKNIVFDPKEAVDINGDTGSFVQYTYVRTKSLLAKIDYDIHFQIPEKIMPEEENLIIILAQYSQSLFKSSEALDPSDLAQYVLNLSKIFNRFYTQLPILKEENSVQQLFRVYLTNLTYHTLSKCLQILGIPLPDKM